MSAITSIENKLKETLQPSHLEVIDESYMHNVEPGRESHVRIVAVSDKFESLNLVKILNDLTVVNFMKIVNLLTLSGEQKKINSLKQKFSFSQILILKMVLMLFLKHSKILPVC